MSPRSRVPPVVFLGTAVPSVLLMHYFDIGGDLRIVIAIGAISAAIVQSRVARRSDDKSGP